ncbi:MAG: hypothetical protein GX885_07800 [Methanomicrobiales archaeon]|nr:hypothetical protein [Methanomicrobiales archaeon]
MTVVTTSRNPLPEVRSLARDLAFAVGGRYITRGKAGMGDILSRDRSVLVVSRSGSYLRILVFSDAEPEPAAGITLRSCAVKERTGGLIRGLLISDRPAYEALRGHVDAVFAVETIPEHRIVFDGAQRRHYALEIVP